ncbi:MFS general substrate transporter [Gonapodya prolifera JEL478]|uniref:MFS general substrate transporter n=1 Tax=Gonapodya prolifera (strain JEL478) TaxID=1344416 RepID=A0A139AWB1_GONPJ|nr:MFS general substrate transporter [Gonapodya prolifera JEL478]|eukprot:KXS20994.1 MFS general substrate transporter [Gonapodya prolifera JEL478]
MSELKEKESQEEGWTRDEEAALVKKLDWKLMPFAMCLFTAALLDRNNYGNARVLNQNTDRGLENELGMHGYDYQLSVSIFFVTYVLCEVPSNMLLKKFTPRVWFTRIMVTWGIISACQGACSNLAGIIVCRLLIGVAEASLLPGLILWISFWYKPFEIAFRTALIHCNVSIAGAFTGLLATAIGQMHLVGGLSAWRWVFILEGIPSLVLSVITFIFLPDYPHTSTFLSEREKDIAIRRLPPTAPSHLDKDIDKSHFRAILTDPMNLIHPLSYGITILPQSSLSYFLPTILLGMGFSGTMSNLMSVWPNLWAGCFEIWCGFHGDKTQERALHIAIPSIFSMLGWILVPVGGKNGWPVGLRYFFVFFCTTGIGGAPGWFSWRQNMLSGSTQNAVVLAWINTVCNAFGAVAPFLFPSSAGPNYEVGGAICAACWAASILGCGVVYMYDRTRRKNGFYRDMEEASRRELDKLNEMYKRAEETKEAV